MGNDEFIFFQGGMGVKISGAGLAGAVPNSSEGHAIGTLAAVGNGVENGDFDREKQARKEEIDSIKNIEEKRLLLEEIYTRNNKEALKKEIRKARSLTRGTLAVNIMHALSDYSSLVRGALEENIDIIVSGAGIPKDLPSYLPENSKTLLVPIVSSARLAKIMCNAWGKHRHLPDAIIVEGPKAGGHLGYSFKELSDPEFVSKGLERIIPEVVSAVKEYETEKIKIPVIAAGGIFYGGDIKKFLKLGASGVQVATRLVTTHECDASLDYKNEYIKCNPEDIEIINSPVGMPGRAIKNKFLNSLFNENTKIKFGCDYRCLKTCEQLNSRYCIANALVEAKRGDFTRGFVFCGSNAYRCKENGIISVKQVFDLLRKEYEEGKTSD